MYWDMGFGRRNMVKTLTVTCPHCNQVSEIYLSTNACVIILNCPACVSPIMYFEKKIFLLSEQQVKAIKGTTQNATVMKMLDKIAHPEYPAGNVVKSIKHTKKAASAADSRCVHLFRPERQKYISEDDITNLRIELALCSDVEQFIAQIK